tara:strand:- start:69 stop:392 length:324 start_codon:yes stop_codon:yes gene_type:complete
MDKPKPKQMAGVKRVLQYFSEARVSMLIECNRHPVLKAQLLELESKEQEWEEWIAEIASYCNVAMDGLYSQEDLEILYPQLTKRMIDTRLSYTSGIVLTPATGRMDS